MSRETAERILQGPSHITDPPTSWYVMTSAGGRTLAETVQAAIHVDRDDVDPENRDAVISGRMNGDGSYVIALQPPRSANIIVRLCTSPSHGTVPHWHWYENAVKGDGHDEEVPRDVCDRLHDRDDLLAHFCDRLNITGLQIQGEFPDGT